MVLGVWARLKKFPYFNPNPNSFFPRKKKKNFFGFQSQKALQTIAMIQTNWSSEFERVWRSSHILTLTLTRFSLEKLKLKKFWISKPKSPSNYSNDTDELVLGVWARLKKFPYFNPNPNSFFPRKKKKKFGFQSQKALQTIAMIQTNWSSEFERVWRSSHILTLTLTRFSLEKKKNFFGFQSQKALQTIAMIQTNWSSEFERVWRSSHILTLTLTRFSLEKKKK